MKRILFITLITMVSVWSNVHAVPAMPGWRTFTQSDGTTIEVQLVGNEFNHSFITRDGLPVERNSKGDFCYNTPQGLSPIIAHSPSERNNLENQFIEENRSTLKVEALKSSNQKKLANAIRKAAPTTPTSGSPRFPVLLVNFSDVKFSHTPTQIEESMLTGEKSVGQYFSDMSNGKYTPQFDVYGIYTLNNNRKYYGGSNAAGTDERPGTMTKDVLNLATDVDFSKYDNNNDGYIDAVIIIYAGVGQAQSGVTEAVWPLQALMSETYGSYSVGGLKVERFALFNELNLDGSNGKIDGIGTFCHEFSHTLGLADYYPTATYQYGVSPYGMGTWSIMDMGCYNDNTYTPIGYGAYEKSFLGWINLITPTENTRYTLPVFNSGSESTDKAVKVTYDYASAGGNEYIILENRAKQGWDAFIKDEGVLATHVTYYKTYFDANEVNVYNDAQMMTIFAADNDASDESEESDLYGETNHELTDHSSPAAIGIWGGSYGYFGKPITEINLNANGTASFWYIKGENTELVGDVNLDGIVDVDDVNCVVQVILGKVSAETYGGRADVNASGDTDIDDVNAIIAIMLNK